MSPKTTRAATALLDDLRARHNVRSQQNQEAPAPPSRAAYDFGDMPELQRYRMMEMAAETLGLESPFFRRHDGASGPKQLVEGSETINFASYNYLGLTKAPEVLEAAQSALMALGLSPGASRLVGGEQALQHRLEARLAEVYNAEAAIAMVSGHATNVTTIGTLLGPEDLILTDQLAHNSIIEGARLSGATRVSFPHNDLDWLERHLEQSRHRHRRALIVVEGLYSMDGDMPELARLIEIKARHDAWLMVDEAHALGVLGANGRGVAEAQGVDPREVEIWMGTLSKTLGACGGYVAGSANLVKLLKHGAPGFVFSVGLSPVLAAGAEAALAAMGAEPERVQRLHRNGRVFRDALRGHGLDTGPSQGFAITPVITGDSVRAVALSSALLKEGINALPVVYPAVPEKAARVRFFVTSEHREQDLTATAAKTAACLAKIEGEADATQARLVAFAGQLKAQQSGSIRDLNP